MCFLLFFFRFVLLLFSDVFFSFQVEEHLVCSLPRVALKIHFIKRHQERREETEANLFHSLSSSFFFFPFVFRVCFVFIAHFTVIFSNSPSLFPSCHGTHPHVLLVGWKQNTPVLEKKTFHGLTIAIKSSDEAPSVPVDDLFKSLPLPNNWNDKKSIRILLGVNHNWQVSKNRFRARGFMCATCTNIRVSYGLLWDRAQPAGKEVKQERV